MNEAVQDKEPARSLPASEPGRSPLDERLFLGVVVFAVLVIAAFTTFSILRSRRSDANASRQLIDFTLTDRTGRAVSRAELDGQFLVVNFVFAGCSLSCLQVNYRMAEVQRLTAGQSDVHLVSLTVDPQSDTPLTLAKFAARFSADPDRWLFLTGDKRVLYPLLEQSFLGPGDVKLAGFVPGGFTNTDRIAVVDQRGQIRAMLNGTKTSATEEVMETLAKLRRENLRR